MSDDLPLQRFPLSRRGRSGIVGCHFWVKVESGSCHLIKESQDIVYVSEGRRDKNC